MKKTSPNRKTNESVANRKTNESVANGKTNESVDCNNILNLDCNSETNNMINDIVGMFQNNLNEEDNDGNPFKNIMDVTKKITEQYQGKIENGDIDLDGLFKNIQKSMPNLPNLNLMVNQKKK